MTTRVKTEILSLEFLPRPSSFKPYNHLADLDHLAPALSGSLPVLFFPRLWTTGVWGMVHWTRLFSVSPSLLQVGCLGPLTLPSYLRTIWLLVR